MKKQVITAAVFSALLSFCLMALSYEPALFIKVGIK